MLGISVDSQFVHKAWVDRGDLGDLKYPLLGDLTKDVSADYGVLNKDGFALRGTFLINPEGEVRHLAVNPPETGRDVADILRTLDALQSGGLCPANWKKGDATLG